MNADLEDDDEDDVYASIPMVEYLSEQSFASLTSSSATASSVRRSSFPMVGVQGREDAAKCVVIGKGD